MGWIVLLVFIAIGLLYAALWLLPLIIFAVKWCIIIMVALFIMNKLFGTRSGGG